jgi:hypothetical protein
VISTRVEGDRSVIVAVLVGGLFSVVSCRMRSNESRLKKS